MAPRRSTRMIEAAARPKGEETARVTKPRAAPKPKPQKYDCTTCDRTLAASSFPKYLATDACTHLINTCKRCTKTWIATQLENTTYNKLVCPECPATMRNSDVKLHADRDIYERFDELERKGIAEKTPEWRWCLSPKCRAGQVHHSPEQAPVEVTASSLPLLTRTALAKLLKRQHQAADICTCHECGAEACVPCDRPYHTGKTCEEYRKQQTKEEEEASLATIAQACKPCPRCKKNIEKNGGCDSMYCSQCGVQFCWRCMKVYQDINLTGHDKGCVYARPGAFDPHALPPPVVW